MGVILDKQVSLWVSKGSRQLSGGSMSFSGGFIGLNRTQLGSFGSVEISGGHLRVSEASWRSMSVTGAQWRPMGISGAHCAMHVHSVLHSFFSSFTCTTLRVYFEEVTVLPTTYFGITAHPTSIILRNIIHP